MDTGRVIEFQEPEHERLMRSVARRLGFDLVSLRLELFGRKREIPKRESPKHEPPRPAAAEPDVVRAHHTRASR